MDELLSLKWTSHCHTFMNILGNLRKKELYTDATLACEGKFYSVHKLVLSTCSDYFSSMLDRTACKSPVIVLKDIKCGDLEALLDYMYLGEVNVRQSDLATLIKAAECLRVKGLAVPDDEPPPARKSRGSDSQPRRGDTSGSPPAKRKRCEVDNSRDTILETSPRKSSASVGPNSPVNNSSSPFTSVKGGGTLQSSETRQQPLRNCHQNFDESDIYVKTESESPDQTDVYYECKKETHDPCSNGIIDDIVNCRNGNCLDMSQASDMQINGSQYTSLSEIKDQLTQEAWHGDGDTTQRLTPQPADPTRAHLPYSGATNQPDGSAGCGGGGGPLQGEKSAGWPVPRAPNTGAKLQDRATCGQMQYRTNGGQLLYELTNTDKDPSSLINDTIQTSYGNVAVSAQHSYEGNYASSAVDGQSSNTVLDADLSNYSIKNETVAAGISGSRNQLLLSEEEPSVPQLDYVDYKLGRSFQLDYSMVVPATEEDRLHQTMDELTTLPTTLCSVVDPLQSKLVGKEAGQPESLYKCPHCPRVMKFPSKLERHILTHSNVRSFQCKFCSYSAKRPDNLKSHCLSMHKL